MIVSADPKLRLVATYDSDGVFKIRFWIRAGRQRSQADNPHFPCLPHVESIVAAKNMGDIRSDEGNAMEPPHAFPIVPPMRGTLSTSPTTKTIPRQVSAQATMSAEENTCSAPVLKPHRRIVELDALRALAAINLVLFHFTHVYCLLYTSDAADERVRV